MTTIAYDGETLAADSRFTNGYVDDTAKKIFKIGNIYIATAGRYSQALIFIKWCRDRTKEKPKAADLGEFQALEIRNGKPFEYDEHCEPVPMSIPAAVGSGAQFAMGAMKAGLNSKQAVRIAMKLDHNTGGKIKTVKIK